MQRTAKGPEVLASGRNLQLRITSTARGVGGVFAILAAIALCCMRNVGADTSVRTITVRAVRYEFDPSEITLTKGQVVRLVFVADDVGHGISVPGLGIDVDLPRHKAQTVTIAPATSGDFDGECSKYCGTGHGDMTFLIHVKP
jgi:cytochrome c oxidase subunit 2